MFFTQSSHIVPLHTTGMYFSGHHPLIVRAKKTDSACSKCEERWAGIENWKAIVGCGACLCVIFSLEVPVDDAVLMFGAA